MITDAKCHRDAIYLFPRHAAAVGSTITEVGDPARGLAGTRTIALAFFAFAFAIPLLQLLALIALWFGPLALRLQRWVFVPPLSWARVLFHTAPVMTSTCDLRSTENFSSGCNDL